MLSKIFRLKNFVWFCAIGLASFSGYYSVFGISKLFSAGSLSIVGMAAMLELSKLVVVTFIHNHFKTLRLLFKSYLIGAALVLMIITSIGVYGYLTNSYQETSKQINQTQNESNLLDNQKAIFQNQKAQIDQSISEKSERIKSYDKIRISQENTYNTAISEKRGSRGLQKNIQSIDKTTNNLNSEISALSNKSLAISDSIATLEQKKLNITSQLLGSELGPLLYLSKITGLQMDIVVNWFILVLVVVFDPLAVSLVIAANHIKEKPTEIIIKSADETKSEIPESLEKIPSIIQENDLKLEKNEESISNENNLDTPENISILNSSDFSDKQAFYNEELSGTKRYTRGISV